MNKKDLFFQFADYHLPNIQNFDNHIMFCGVLDCNDCKIRTICDTTIGPANYPLLEKEDVEFLKKNHPEMFI